MAEPGVRSDVMTDEELIELGRVLAAFLADEMNYVGGHTRGDDPWMTLDGRVHVTPKQKALLIRVAGSIQPGP